MLLKGFCDTGRSGPQRSPDGLPGHLISRLWLQPRTEPQVPTTGTRRFFWPGTARGTPASGHRQRWGEQACPGRSFPAGKAHPAETAGQHPTSGQQSHDPPRAGTTGSLQWGAPGRGRAPRAPYLPLLQLQPCCSRGLKAARHIPIASHRIPVCQQPPTSLSSGSCRTAEPRLLCAVSQAFGSGSPSLPAGTRAQHGTLLPGGSGNRSCRAVEHGRSSPPGPAEPTQLHTGHADCKHTAADIFKTQLAI